MPVALAESSVRAAEHLHLPAGVPPVPVSRSRFCAGTPQAMLVLAWPLQRARSASAHGNDQHVGVGAWARHRCATARGAGSVAVAVARRGIGVGARRT